jgi:ubiquinone/menaquinone biosynthesis C-methylase UbiE
MSDHFSRVAVEYASFRPHYPDQLFTTLAQLAPGRRRAWDCATGSGQAAIGLARSFECVVATDSSAAQVRQAAAHPKVRYAVARAEAASLGDQSVELITVAQALHWFDLERFYGEARRVLTPGGVLAVWTYANLQVDRGPIDAALYEFYTDVVGAYWPDERRLVETGYRTLPFPFDEFPVDSPPMTASWNRSRLLGYVRTWSAVQRYVEATGMNPVPRLGERIALHWSDPEVPREIEWPLTVRAGRTRPASLKWAVWSRA